MQILENIALAPYTTLKVGGPARYFVEAKSETDILDALAYAHEHSVEVFVLGGGSNLVISDAGWPGLVLKISIVGMEMAVAPKSSSGRDSSAACSWARVMRMRLPAKGRASAAGFGSSVDIF